MVVTWNPSDKDADITLSNGDLTASSSVDSRRVRATLGRSTGKYYFEIAFTGRVATIGLSSIDSDLTGTLGFGTYAIDEWGVRGLKAIANLQTVNDSAGTNRDAYTYSADHVLQVAVDLDAQKIWFGYDNTWLNSGDPAAATNPAYTNVYYSYGDNALYPTWSSSTADTTSSCTARFVASDFSYSVPSGFSAWDSSTSASVELASVALSVSTGAITGNSPTVVLFGGVVNAQVGGLGSHIESFVDLLSANVSIQLGLLVPLIDITEYELAGHQVSAASGFITTNYAALIGVQTSLSAGTLASSVFVGASTSTLSPTVTTSAINNSNPASHSPVGAFSFQNNFLPTGVGELVGSGETVYNGYYVTPAVVGRYHHGINPTTEATSFSVTPYYSSGEFNNFGGVASTYGSYQYDFAPSNVYGGQFSVGLDGVLWFVLTRAYGRIDGDTLTPDVLHMLKGPAGWYGGAIQRPNVDVGISSPLGIYAHNSQNVYIFYSVVNGANTVPAYRKYAGVGGFDVSAEFNTEVQLSSFTGNANTAAVSNSMCVTRSGYGDIIYITYESSTGHVGLIVMDAVTETVTSHTLTANITPATSFVVTNEIHLQKVPTRSLSEVAVLSSGVSVTQFLAAAAFVPRIVHLSWTREAHTTPTLTLKAGPTDTSLAGGLESLEIRGDQVFHVLYKYQHTSLTSPDRDRFGYKLQVNDATGVANSWSLSDEIWSWTVAYDIFRTTSIPSLHFSGFGDGYKTLLCLIPTSRYDYAPNYSMGWAYLDFWVEKYTLLSVPTLCKVGRVTVTLLDALAPMLAGKVVAVITGTLSSRTSVTQSLGGVQLVVSKGELGFNGDIPPVGIYGFTTTVSDGVITPVISQALVGQLVTTQTEGLATVLAAPLSCQSISVFSALLAPRLSLALTGQSLATHKGFFTSNINVQLSGIQISAQSSQIQLEIRLGLSGVQIAVSLGLLTPTISITLAGKIFSVLSGSLGQKLYVNLLGKVLSIEIGAFEVHSDITLPVQGVQTTGQVGVYPTSTNVRMATAHLLLWARTEVGKLVTQAESTALEARTVDTKIYTQLDEADPLFNDTDEML
jgi:hypothetical protein